MLRGSTSDDGSLEAATYVISLLALTGCIEFGFDPIDDPSPPRTLVLVQDFFVQEPLPALDVLFVVDASPSMSQELVALAAGVDELMAGLNGLGVAWQLGVVGAAGGSTADGILLGAPWVITPETPERAARFADALPTSGASGEGGLAAAVWALEESADGDNLGFRRPRATLHTVFVSDGDDDSDDLLNGDATSSFLDALANEALRYDAPAFASALVGDVPGGCTSVRGAAQPGVRYANVALATGGEVASICAEDLGAVLATVGKSGVVFPFRFVLSGVPATDDIEVRVDGTRTLDWSLETEPPAVVFNEVPTAGAFIDITYSVANTQGAP